MPYLYSEPKIIYKDKDVLVLNKPGGWITNSANTTKSQPVIQDWVRKNYQTELTGFENYRDGIVHRLDKDTSGLLLVARNKLSFEDLQKQFKNREIKKTYIALLHGRLEPKAGEIKAAVGRLPWRRDRFGVLPGGREAISLYKVIDYFSLMKDIFSLTEFEPQTGRTHQIRIHAKYLNHPIVADEFYAGRKTARKDRIWCPRLFLHASIISFIHPSTKKRLIFKISLPDDLERSLGSLQKI